MQKRDVKAAAIGAAVTAIVFLGGYGGKVAVSYASSSGHSSDSATKDLRAGDSAGLGGAQGTSANGDHAKGDSDSALDQAGNANKNLVTQVSDYRSRLQAMDQEKRELEAKLKKSEERLAAAQDGSAGSLAATKHDFDLGPDEWKELAKDGTIKYQMPCIDQKGWSPSPEKLQNLGLAPSDGATIKTAYANTSKQVWAEIKPLCAQAVGSADIAEKIGPDTCVHLVLDVESDKDSEATKAARRQVGEIRAGSQPMPTNLDDKKVNPVLKLFLATTSASKTLEDDLAQSYGPEEAHRLVYSDEMCMGTSVFGGRPKPRK